MSNKTQPQQAEQIKLVIQDNLLQKKIHWTPHQNQKTILEQIQDKRNISIAAGVRFGKSALAGYLAFKHLLCDNQRIWIVSLSYDMAQKVFAYVNQFAGIYDKRLLRNSSNRPPQRFEIPEVNSFLECKSIENVSSLLGEELDLVIFDEAARFPSEIYERYIAARLSSRRGKLISISTPFGKNWFYRNHLQADAKFNFKTIDNPTWALTEEQLKLPEEERKKVQLEEWDKLRKSLPEQIFKQEYEAAFMDDAASVFRGVRSCIDDNCLEDVRNGHSYILGVDLGRVEDYTVITVMDRTENKVVYWDRFNKIDYVFQKARITSVAQRYNFAKIIIDSTTLGSPIKEDLERDGNHIDDFKFSMKSKKELVEKLSICLEQQLISIPNNPVLLEELESFGYHVTESRNIVYSAPKGFHDDAVYSLALAVWGLTPYKIRKVNVLKQMLNAPRSYPTSFI